MKQIDEIFVSTSGIRSQKISESVTQLALAGFTSIELSGGTKAYPELIEDLVSIKNKFGLTYRCHNYFPPPEVNFVLNLSSQCENFERTITHLIKTIDLSHQLGCDKLGVHCGFRIDPRVDELGKKITSQQLIEFDDSVKQFCNGFKVLSSYAESKNIALYVENNVFSAANKKSFSGRNPFLLTHYNEYLALVEKEPFKLLLDVAHLKVSCQSLNLNFNEQMNMLVPLTDYIHISDNDGQKDSNEALTAGTDLYYQLQRSNLRDKTFTLEVYSGIEDTLRSYDVLKSLTV